MKQGLKHKIRRVPGVEVFPFLLPDVTEVGVKEKQEPAKIEDVNNYYKILGLVDDNGNVLPDLTQDDIKRAYRQKCKEYHPDVSENGRFDLERFRMVQLAYRWLGDPDKRSYYNSIQKPEVVLDAVVLERLRRQKSFDDYTIKVAPTHTTVNKEEREHEDYYEQSAKDYAESQRVYPVYYLHEDCDVDQHKVVEWLPYFQTAFWALGLDQEIKLGFTKSDHLLLEKHWWGCIFLIPESEKPATHKAIYYVAQGLFDDPEERKSATTKLARYFLKFGNGIH